MAKLHGTDVDLDNELMVGLRDCLLGRREIIKRNGEYFYTIKHIQHLDRSFRRLRRCDNNSFWKFYYSFFNW